MCAMLLDLPKKTIPQVLAIRWFFKGDIELEKPPANTSFWAAISGLGLAHCLPAMGVTFPRTGQVRAVRDCTLQVGPV